MIPDPSDYAAANVPCFLSGDLQDTPLCGVNTISDDDNDNDDDCDDDDDDDCFLASRISSVGTLSMFRTIVATT